MLAAIANKVTAAPTAGRALAAIAQRGAPTMVTSDRELHISSAPHEGDRPLTEQIKEVASKVPEAVSGAMNKAKTFVQEATDRVKYDKEGYTDAIKHKAQEVAGRAEEGAANIADKAARAAADGNADAVNAATGGGMHNPMTGERGPSAVEGTGGDMVRETVEQLSGDVTQPPPSSMPAGTLPINEKQRNGPPHAGMGRGSTGGPSAWNQSAHPGMDYTHTTGRDRTP